MIVVAFDKDIGGENRVGEAATNAKGEFRIAYAEAALRRSSNERRGPDVLVRVYDGNRVLLFTSTVVQNAGRELRIDVKLPARKLVVRGRVTGARKGMLVFAYDKDLRSEQQLAKPFELGDDGVFAIGYDAADFARAEKGAADLRIAVCEPGGRELHTSQIIFNAGPDVTVDLALPGTQATVSPEYERYLQEIEPLLQGLTMAELDAKDGDFVAGDTGIDRQHIQWLIQAAQLELAVTRIPAAFFYGWFRLGMPTAWEELQVQSIALLRSALLDAIDQNIIARELRDGIEDVLLRIPNPRLRELVVALEGTALPLDKLRAVLEKADSVAPCGMSLGASAMRSQYQSNQSMNLNAGSNLANERGHAEVRQQPREYSRMGGKSAEGKGGVIAVVDRQGALALAIEKTDKSSGTMLFLEAVGQVGSAQVKAVEGKWNTEMPSNLNMFNENLRAGMSPEDAARATYTGKWRPRSDSRAFRSI